MSLKSDTQVAISLVAGFLDDSRDNSTIQPNTPAAIRLARVTAHLAPLTDDIISFKANALGGPSMNSLKTSLEQILHENKIA